MIKPFYAPRQESAHPSEAVAALPRQVASNVLLVALESAAADFVQLGVAQEALHLVLARVAVAAENLHGDVGDALGHRRREQLGRIRADAVAAAGRDARRLAVDQAAGGFRVRERFADVTLDLAELRDGFPEC